MTRLQKLIEIKENLNSIFQDLNKLCNNGSVHKVYYDVRQNVRTAYESMSQIQSSYDVLNQEWKSDFDISEAGDPSLDYLKTGGSKK